MVNLGRYQPNGCYCVYTSVAYVHTSVAYIYTIASYVYTIPPNTARFGYLSIVENISQKNFSYKYSCLHSFI